MLQQNNSPVKFSSESNVRPEFDQEIIKIADYVAYKTISSALAYETAYYCLIDSIGCALLALKYPECIKLLGPVIPEETVSLGARVLGTSLELNPIQAAFNNGLLIRWLDYNDTWLAAEWGHPSDNLGGILAVSDYVSRKNLREGKKPLRVRDVLTALIKAYEIQGILALENSFNRVGIDHVVLVKLASAAVTASLWGCDTEMLRNAISLVFVDGQSLRTYRHAPNTGTRKSWAAGDATSRGTFLAWLALKGEMGYPSALSAKTWGFCDVYFKGESLKLSHSFDSYVMENILFKISYPAEFHGQTAVECALKLHEAVKDRLEEIEKIVIKTQESAIRIINKAGPLHNPADRDHSLQYMVAVALIYGKLTADHYEDNTASNFLIDQLRAKMEVQEKIEFSRDYLDSTKRSIANALQITFKDGRQTEEIIVEYPVGHKQRRKEGIPLLKEKFEQSLAARLPKQRVKKIIQLVGDQKSVLDMPVNDFMGLFLFEGGHIYTE